ncbi:MAG: valine--tRNA ligase [Spirochaetales bacterium]|nr:valine--tRNA ligase [Spirochaetales bacterium]
MTEDSALPKTYSPAEIEPEINTLWLEQRAFHAEPDGRGPGERYVIMMPLPNVTGALHMGHAIDNGMQDLLVRWHRMRGRNALWMPGTDHAGIGTQAVVEKRLKELEGVTRHDLGREGLVERIWRWKDQYQARIIAQQQRMGCSCDWDRQRFTMDAVCARAVRRAFFKMFSDGLIFRGLRLVNWDVFLRTTISDDEIEYETVAGFFWHLRYPVIDPRSGEPEYVTVATTRPETMLGDTAVAVHPDPEHALDEKIAETRAAAASDPAKAKELEALTERKRELLPLLLQLRDMARDGREVRLPLLDRPIPLIADVWAKPELGSGCVKITPAHDHNDYEVWNRHRERIGIVNILNPDGTLNEAAGPYRGLERFQARERIVENLKELGLVEKIEEHEIEIGHSDRSKTPVEPYLSYQWFVKMGDRPGGVIMGRGTKKEFTAPGLVQAAMDAVTDGRVSVHPSRYAKTYLDWLAEKRDWPISRQLWWGHRIPIWSREMKKADVTREIGFLKSIGPEQAGGLMVKAVLPETGESFFIGGGDTLDHRHLPGKNDSTLRVEACLLEDDAELTDALAEAGFEQDPDVLDTWFSSALWPFSTLGWPDPETAPVDAGQATLGSVDGKPNCLDYYYPGSCLVTARDIITLWVARMVLAGLYCLGDVPFRDVFIHATILDGKGVRMSKSKGNGIDPVDIVDAYGTDAMRYVLADMQTGTQDIRLPVTAVCPSCGFHNDLGSTAHGSTIFSYVCGKNLDGSKKQGSCGKEFDVLGTLPDLPQAKLLSERFETGRAFCTKLWNSARFAFMNLRKDAAVPSPEDLAIEDRWILSVLSRTIREADAGLADYNPNRALGALRDFFWGSLCDWYLEAIKPRLGGKTGDMASGGTASAETASRVLAYCLDRIFRLFHPFVPFITEYLWQRLRGYAPERGLAELAQAPDSELLIRAAWPEPENGLENPEIEALFAEAQAVIRLVREVRAGRGLPPKQSLTVTLKPPAAVVERFRQTTGLVIALAGIEKLVIDTAASRPSGSVTTLAGDTVIFVHDLIDDEKEKTRLLAELKKIESNIASAEKKLANEDFSSRAPKEIVDGRKKRLADLVSQRRALQVNLRALSSDQPQ